VGLLDIFGGKPGPEKANKLKAKVTQKYGDATVRQKAISQLGEMKVPEAVTSLMARYTIAVDPATTDADEKEHVFTLVTGFGKDAVVPVTEFLKRSDQASSWALKILSALLPEQEVVSIAVDLLIHLGSEYTRDPEKKMVLIQFLEGKNDPRIGGAVMPFLEDQSDEVKLAAVKLLGEIKHEPAREPLLQLLTSEETARRVRTQVFATLAAAGFGVQGYREKVEALLNEPYFVDKSGVVKKRG
jgi:HEAT repeat protein